MRNAFITKSSRCCTQEHDLLVRKLGACEMESNTPGERHDCYRKAAKESGRRAKKCMAEGNR